MATPTSGAPDAGAGWLDEPLRATLEREVFPRHLPKQRWYAGKARALESARFVDVTAPGAVAGGAALALVEVRYRDGSGDTYFVPLTLKPGDRPLGEASGREVTRLETAVGELNFVVDALADPPTCAALLGLIERSGAIPAGSGTLRGEATPLWAELRGPSGSALEPKPKTVEQSNSVVVFGDRLFMKVFRKLEPGLNPDVEICRFLGERAGFDRIPRLAGTIAFDRPGAEPYTLAIVQELVDAQGTGWEFALGRVAAYYEDPGDGSGPLAEAEGDARTLGRRTAELHRALASDPGDPAFAPESIGPNDLDRIAASARRQVETALAALRERQGELEGPARDQAARVLEAAPGLLDRLAGLRDAPVEASKIRCHGDYHLGQVLRVGDDYVILDFEGEPARPLEERRAKMSPLRDVVGMLRSYDYAAYAGLFAHAGDRREVFDRLAPRARLWRDRCSSAFLDAYRAEAGDAAFLPRDPSGFDALLAAFTLEKALYELLYELANRPTWVPIPLQGVLGLIEASRAG